MPRKYNKEIEKNFLLIINIILIIICIYLIKDIFSLIIFSFILSYFLHPIYKYFLKKFENDKLASLLSLTTAVIIIFVPFFIMSYFLVLNLIKIIVKYSFYLKNPEILNTLITNIIADFTNSSLFNNIDFSYFLNYIVTFITGFSKNFFSSIPKYILFFFIMLFITYYILIYNTKILNAINEYLPLSLKRQNELLTKVGKNIKVLFKGYFLTGIIQTITALIGYLIFSAPYVFIITFLTLLTSLIPYIGTAFIWIPISIYMIITGSKLAGIGLLIYGTFIINLIDNFLRPYLMSSKETISPVLVFIGFIGGLFAFGIVGIILGPLIITITSIFLKYLIQHYENN